MKEHEFIDYLNGHTREYDYARGEHDGTMGLYVKNKTYDTEIHIAYNTIEQQDLDALIKATHCGRHVDQIEGDAQNRCARWRHATHR